jgi:(2R)-ethylmalonyl-CoA mutase
LTPRRRDEPWVFRTYSGHTSARASNELYRRNLENGQTGLSVAFDLPTQTGYDSDHPLAHGEVGKVGVPICHVEDLEALFVGIPLGRMNTSMTINATAAWLLACLVAVAERQRVDPRELRGTTQNDIIKEYLSRGTYVFPPQPSLRLISDMVAYTVERIPRWNPINVCSYHLQEAGATPAQEIAYALATAIAVLDAVRARADLPQGSLPRVVGRISFFLNSGIRFVEEVCKVRAMAELWDELTRRRYGVEEQELRRFRYGVQVNSLGLTEAQPENNVIRIVLEALGVTLSKRARCRALQLPAWNEALGLPRPWDQQWSLRIQQILAFETDLLEHEDLFDGSRAVEARVREIAGAAREELDRVLGMGGAVAAVENAYMKQRLVESHTARVRAIEAGELPVAGVNLFTEGEPSPLLEGARSILTVDESAEREQVERLRAFRARRNASEVAAALRGLRDALASGGNVMPPSIRAAQAGVTTGEWADALRGLFGEYRAPTGVVARPLAASGPALEALRGRVRRLAERLGRPPKILVGKPGLDGHSNGAEQIAVRGRDAGFEVVYEGIRLTPAEIVQSAHDEGVHVVGLSILSGSHGVLVLDVLDGLRKAGLESVPVVVGGIIPEGDAEGLRRAGVRAVYTPRDFDLCRIYDGIVDLVEAEHPVV